MPVQDVTIKNIEEINQSIDSTEKTQTKQQI